jgi:hypothetical protein
VSEELAIPGTGALVSLEDEEACAIALDDLRAFERSLSYQISEAKSILTAAIVERSKILGTKTIHLHAGGKAVIQDGAKTSYDPGSIETLESDLRALGLPEDRLHDLIKETVTRTVDGRVAKSVAAANEDYAAAIASARSVTDRPSYVVISR